MKRSGAMLVLVMLAGCGPVPQTAPAFGRLGAGSEAITYDRTERKVAIMELPKGSGVAFDLDFLPLGTKVRVIDDSEKDMEAKELEGNREVHVVPLEGRYEGISAKIMRKNLKPLAK